MGKSAHAQMNTDTGNTNISSSLPPDESLHAPIKEPDTSIINRLMRFEFGTALSKWWDNESPAAKISFLSALIIGFVSHIFVYTGRYYGRDDMGTIFYDTPAIGTGRWFGAAISNLSYKYVIPLIAGIFVTCFLAASALLVCKLLDIDKKINAVLIAGLLTTFPSIANTNLFLYETSSYHFAVMLGALAVYITVKYKLGFLIGSIFALFTLAIYQSKYNVALALSIFFILTYLLGDRFNFKDLFRYMTRLVLMVLISAVSYAVSLPISMRYYGSAYNNYRGFSSESMRSRLLTLSGFKNALVSTYRNFYDGFFGNIYLVVEELRYAYVVTALLCLIFLLMIIISKKLYTQYVRLFLIAILILLVPFASNFANFFDTGSAYGLMIYAFVLTLAFAVSLGERYINGYPVFRSALAICMFFIIGNFIVGNNVYYLRAYYFNQRTFSIHTRILDRIDPFLTGVDQKRVGLFGSLPNEWYPRSTNMFYELGGVRDGAGINGRNYIGFTEYFRENSKFISGVSRFHGVELTSVGDDDTEEKRTIEKIILDTNMPAWPAEGCVGIINGVVVVNFGITDIVFESDETGQFFRARHWISEGHAQHTYEYSWQVHKNGILTNSQITGSDRLYLNMPNPEDEYLVSVTVRNASVNFNYRPSAIILPAGSYTGGQNIFANFLALVLDDECVMMLSVKDEASLSLDETMQNALYSLGLRETLMGQYGYSYAAIIDGYDVVFEQLSDELISHTEVIDDFSIELVSAGVDVGDVSSICINGQEFSLNTRGINIVVLNKTTWEIIFSIAFDTHTPDHTLTF